MMAGYSITARPENVDHVTEVVTEFIKKGVEKYNGVDISLTRLTRSIAQNACWHAQISDIAKQTKFGSAELNDQGAKHYLVLRFAFDMEQMQTPLAQGIEYIPSRKTEGGFMPVPPSTSKFTVDEGGQFIEWLFAYGAERNVKFGGPAMRHYEELSRM
jgi:hypothetical protein